MNRSTTYRYGVAVACVTLATLARLALIPLLGDRFPLLTYYFALVFSAWFGGLGPALVALLLSLVALPLVLDPLAAPKIPDLGNQVGFGIFGFSGLAIAWMGGSMREALRLVESKNQEARKERARLEAEVVRRRQAEGELERLLQSQRELRLDAERQSATLTKLFEQLPLGVTLLDTELRLTRVNPYYASLCDQTAERLVGQRLGEVLLALHEPEVAAQVEAQFRQVLETGEPLNVGGWSGTLAHRPGVPYFADWSVRRIEDARGEPVGLLLTCVEVTEHVSRELQLRASEERFRTMADASPALIWSSGPDGGCTYFNRHWLEFTGRTSEQESGDGWLGGVHPEDLARCRETYRDAFSRREPFRMSYRLRRADGEYRWILDHGVPWLDAEGGFLGYLGSAVEVHETKLLEEQRDRLLAELEARHAFTDAILRQVPAGILVADAATGKLFLSNKAAHRIVHGQLEPGHVMEDYDERFELKGYHGDGSPYRPEDWPLVRALRHGELIRDEEIRVVCGDGTPLTLSVNAGPVRDSSGQVVAAVAAFHDISALKRAELEASETAARFQHMANAIPQIVWVVMPDRSLSFINRRWSEYTGLTEAQSTEPAGYESVVHPEDLPRVRAKRIEADELRGPFQDEFRLRDRDGNFRWFLGRSLPVYDDQGRLVCRFGTATDIDERKRAEQSARFLADASTTLAELVDERLALQHVAQLAVPGFADWCAIDMLVPDAPPQRLALAHVDPRKVAFAEDLHREFPPDPSDSSGVYPILRSGRSEIVPEITDAMLVAGARDDRHLEILRELGLRSYMGVPIRARGGILGVITFIAAESGRRYGPEDLRVAQDLASRAAIAVENARLYQELKDADLRKDEFLATLAHEIRNPLAPIQNSLRLLAHPDGVDREQERLRAERMLVHLTRLVDDLEDIGRINRGMIELRREVVELAPIVGRAVESIGFRIEDRNQVLSVDLPERPIHLDADPIRLEQVLWNLLENTISRTPSGGRISLSAAIGPENVEILVANEDAGDAAEASPRILETPGRKDSRYSRSESGLGIGLGLVGTLVQQHGGTFQSRSVGVGRGCEFRVILPVVPQPSTEGPAPESSFAAAATSPEEPSTRPKRVLFVDDNADAAMSLSRLLALLDGHDTRVVHDGPSALRVVQEFCPDVAVLDIGLPRMDGYELARRLRAMPELRETRLIALTGWGQERDRQLSREAGFERHLVKPVDTELLRQIIAEPARKTPSP